MRLSSFFVISLTFLAAMALALITAMHSVTLIERRSEIGVREALDGRGLTWAEVEANGLQVTMAGVAPNEAFRFQALSAAGTVVDAARIIDEIEVTPQTTLAPPQFSAEILRNDGGISVIGLLPAAEDREALAEHFRRVAGEAGFADLMETADYPVPEGWGDAIAFALRAIEDLPRSKISVEPGRVAIRANTDSAAAKTRLEGELRRIAPPGLQLSLDIAAPRPVLTPFTLRFLIDDEGPRFDACSADSDAAAARIVAAARAAGLSGVARCVVGMGVPSPDWAAAAEQAIAALARLGEGSVTFSDADIVLRVPSTTDQALFDRVVGELENNLPDVFALRAVRPEPENATTEAPEFIATLSPEGLVQLRGRVTDEVSRTLISSFAHSLFGSSAVYSAARLDSTLPDNWTLRVLTGLEALDSLANGVVVVAADSVSVRGLTHDESASADIAQLLADKLGDDEEQEFDISVQFEALPEPEDLTPSPEECEAEISAILAEGQITFEPGNANIDAEALETLDKIGEVLKGCGDIELEIQGHTDSQGREEMNLALSQDRAEAVLNELRARRVLTTRYIAQGYGETQPIADNDTEEGREANRRIEFRLPQPKVEAAEASADGEETLDSGADDATEEGEDAAEDGALTQEATEDTTEAQGE